MKKKLIIALSILAALILLLVALVLLALSDSLKFSYTVADAEADSLLASEIVDMISDSVVDDEGNIPEIAEVSIPPEHLNALLRVAGYRLNRELKEQGIVCSLGWDNATIKAAFSQPAPFSKMLVLRGTAVPSIENGVMHISASGLKVGYLPLPASILNRNIRKKDIGDEKIRLAFEAVHHLSTTPEGGLRLGVYPEKISNLIRILVMDED